MTAPYSGGGTLTDTVIVPLPGALSGVGGLSVSVSDPYPMPGAWPDWEHVLIDLLTPIAYTCQTMPLTAEDIQAALPFIFVRRFGGGLDFNAITDKAHMKTVVFSRSRATSYQLAQQVLETFVSCQGGVDVNGVLVDFAEPFTGPVEMFDIDQQNRTEELDWWFYGRRTP